MSTTTPRPPHRDLADVHAYVVPITPKMLRETLCLAQSGLGALVREHIAAGRRPRGAYQPHLERLELLIAEIDRMRPIGPDGNHDDRHTSVCGCVDKPGGA